MKSDYKFLPAVSAIFVEIFLPKKAKYQGTLYDTLTNGFKLNYKEHFNGEKRADIQHFLEEYTLEGENISEMIDGFVERGERFFFGYSMYEVDGVFVSDKKDKKGDNVLDEERTQVIKLIFKLSDQEVLKKVKRKYRRTSITLNKIRALIGMGLQSTHQKTLSVGQTSSDKTPKDESSEYNYFKGLTKKEREVYSYIEGLTKDWVDDAGIFLFGYIIYELSRGVNKVEEQIWVTSVWDAKVNVVIKNKITNLKKRKTKK